MTHRSYEVRAEGPLYGSSANGNGLQIIYGGDAGLDPNHGNNVPACSRGQEDSSGLSLDFNAGIPLPKWFPLEGFDVGTSSTTGHSNVVSTNWPLAVYIPPHFKTYPIGRTAYNRHEFVWREYDAGGETIVHKADGSVDPHHAVRDVFTGDSVLWAKPIPENDALPQATPTVFVPQY